MIPFLWFYKFYIINGASTQYVLHPSLVFFTFQLLQIWASLAWLRRYKIFYLFLVFLRIMNVFRLYVEGLFFFSLRSYIWSARGRYKDFLLIFGLLMYYKRFCAYTLRVFFFDYDHIFARGRRYKNFLLISGLIMYYESFYTSFI